MLLFGCTPDKGESESAGATTTTTGVTSVTTTGTTGAESTSDEPTTDPGGSSGTGEMPEMKCLLLGISKAVTVDPPVSDGEATGTCTVVAAQPIQLSGCTGAVTGDVTIELTASFAPDLTPGESVEVELRGVGHAEFFETFVRIRSGLATKLVASQAMAVAPAGVTEWFPTNVDVVPAEVGCQDVMCTDGSGLSIRKQGLVFGEGPTTALLEPEDGGVIPGEFGGETYRAFVHEARIGACGASLGEQTSWYAFSIVRTAGP